MGIFNGVGNAESSKRSGFLDAGRYVVRIKRLMEIANRKKVPMVKIEFEIIKASAGQNLIGCTRVQMISTAWDNWHGHVRNFFEAVCEATGKPLETITDKSVESAFDGDGTKLSGLVLAIEAEQVGTLKGGLFTLHNWSAPKEKAAAKALPAPKAKVKALPAPEQDGAPSW